MRRYPTTRRAGRCSGSRDRNVGDVGSGKPAGAELLAVVRGPEDLLLRSAMFKDLLTATYQAIDGAVRAQGRQRGAGRRQVAICLHVPHVAQTGARTVRSRRWCRIHGYAAAPGQVLPSRQRTSWTVCQRRGRSWALMSGTAGGFRVPPRGRCLPVYRPGAPAPAGVGDALQAAAAVAAGPLPDMR